MHLNALDEAPTNLVRLKTASKQLHLFPALFVNKQSKFSNMQSTPDALYDALATTIERGDVVAADELLASTPNAALALEQCRWPHHFTRLLTSTHASSALPLSERCATVRWLHARGYDLNNSVRYFSTPLFLAAFGVPES